MHVKKYVCHKRRSWKFFNDPRWSRYIRAVTGKRTGSREDVDAQERGPRVRSERERFRDKRRDYTLSRRPRYMSREEVSPVVSRSNYNGYARIRRRSLRHASPGALSFRALQFRRIRFRRAFSSPPLSLPPSLFPIISRDCRRDFAAKIEKKGNALSRR